MVKVEVDNSSLTAPASWFGLRLGGNLALSLHSSHELSELSQWPCHCNCTIKIVIFIIVIVFFFAEQRLHCMK